ncbi:MAG: hypothetical protein ACI9GW_000290 [Halieaceae bacterium]|jgi:hypothetical protein
MTNFQVLNNVEHAKMRVITDRGAKYGDSVMFAMTFPFEMRSVQACYPILIQKDPDSGKFYPVALFGFEQGENLFLNGAGWDASYVPAMIRRQPFLIGFQKSNAAAEKQRVVTVDVDHPRVGESDGIAMFQTHGGNSDYLEAVADTLESIHSGNEQNEAFIDALLKLDLVESVTLDITLDDASNNKLEGFYILDDEKLQALEEPALIDLHQQGFLMPAYMMVASQSQMRGLIDRRNARLAR